MAQHGTTLSSNLPTLPNSANTLLIATWFLEQAGQGNAVNILSDISTGGLIFNWYEIDPIQFVYAPQFKLVGYDAGGNVIFAGNVSAGSSLYGGVWHSLAVSINTATHTIQILQDEVLLNTGTISWSSSNPIAFFPGSDTWQIGPSFFPGFSAEWNLFDFYFGAGDPFFDLSQPANVAKLFGAGNIPLTDTLGNDRWLPNGSSITGSIPAVFLHGNDEASFIANLGTGGPFTRTGLPLIGSSTSGPQGTPTEFTGIPVLPDPVTTFLQAGWLGNFGSSGMNRFFLEDRNNGWALSITDNNNGTSSWNFSMLDDSGNTTFASNGSITLPFDPSVGWHSYAISADAAPQTVQILIDLTLVSYVGTGPQITWGPGTTFGFTPGDTWQIGPPQNHAVDIAPLWLNGGDPFFDLSLPNNQAKLFGPGNTFINWGSNGQSITGSSPAIFLYGPAATWANNLGTGGSFMLVPGSAPLINVTGPS